MTARPSDIDTLSRFVAITLCFAIAGCKPSGSHGPLPSGRSGTSTNSGTQATVIPWEKLQGTWKGTASQGSNSISDESLAAIDETGKISPSGKSSSSAKVDFLLVVEEKFLSIKGVETCHLTLSYTSDNAEVTSNRDFYRMIPDDKVGDQIMLRGSGGEFQIRLSEDDQLELQGKARLVGVESMLRNLHATLKRNDKHLGGSVDSSAEPPEPSTTEK
jgi:hypothetical protein